MSSTRAINVLTLSAILFLAGCFGFGDSVEADEEDEVTITTSDLTEAMLLASNSPPDLSVKKFDYQNDEIDGVMKSNWEYSGYFWCLEPGELSSDPIGNTLEEQRDWFEQNSEEDESSVHLANLIQEENCLIYFDFLSVDPDGDSVTKGIDTDFDGNIDIPVDVNFGFTLVSVDSSLIRAIWNGLSVYEESCDQIDVAFIAVDEHGASTSEFMHFLGMGSCTVDEEDSTDYTMYLFQDRDAAGTMSDAAGEKLVHIKMTQGDDLSWSVLKVSIVVDGGNSLTCADASKDDGTADCTYETDDDNYWSTSEEITINEGDVDLCDGADGGCDVDVTLTKIGVGNEDDKVIREVTAYADANN